MRIAKGYVGIGLVLFALCGCGKQMVDLEPTGEPILEAEPIQVTVEEKVPEVAETVEKEAVEEAEEIEEDTSFDFTIDFAGDISFAEHLDISRQLATSPNGIYDCISPELIEEMNCADLMCLNNEFTYSLRGEPLPGKAYTFRANPEKVENLHLLGVDIVKLANNHVYDYGKDALLDTLSTLEEAGIDYMGAGVNLERAMEPIYKEVQGQTIAFVAASRAEKFQMTPQATDTEPGILRCYDPTLFLEVIKEAKAHADIVLAYVHWGTEYSYVLEDVQKETARQYLDAGADVIIGAHSHCLQGMEYYDGKPIFYSLGNYWFNNKTLDTMLLQLHFTGDKEGFQVEPKIFPAVQSGCRTLIAETDAERERIFSLLESISINVEINEEGIVTQVPNSVE